jgi:hypothetical protein
MYSRHAKTSALARALIIKPLADPVPQVFGLSDYFWGGTPTSSVILSKGIFSLETPGSGYSALSKLKIPRDLLRNPYQAEGNRAGRLQISSARRDPAHTYYPRFNT